MFVPLLPSSGPFQMSSFIIFLCGMLSMGEMPPAPGQEPPRPN